MRVACAAKSRQKIPPYAPEATLLDRRILRISWRGQAADAGAESAGRTGWDGDPCSRAGTGATASRTHTDVAPCGASATGSRCPTAQESTGHATTSRG